MSYSSYPNKLCRTVNLFLQQHIDVQKPILLGFSGGPDSMALLHLLVECRKVHSFDLALAHIDHGWRATSAQESLQLAEMADRMGLPFHTIRLNPAEISGNLEEECRKQRLEFFKQLCQKYGYQAVLLGHHADDCAETALKRLFEGARLSHLCGMRSVAAIDGLVLWRPLLSISKRELISFLTRNAIAFIQDCTNDDVKYLRARMRQQLIPDLENIFGKEISHALSRISEESEELRDYLDDFWGMFLSDSHPVGPFGWHWDMSDPRIWQAPLFMLRDLVSRLSAQCGSFFSRQQLQELSLAIKSDAANKRFMSGPHEFIIDRRHLFVPVHFCEFGMEPLVLRLGSVTWGQWRVSVEVVEIVELEHREKATNWREAWNGQGAVILPMEKGSEYTLEAPLTTLLYPGHAPIRLWWNKHKTPAFLRMHMPVIKKEGSVIHEFLTGIEMHKSTQKGLVYCKVSLSI